MPARPLRVVTIFLAAQLGAACSNGLGPDGSSPQPALIILLEANTRFQTFRASWTLPIDSLTTTVEPERPILSKDLHLTLHGPGGTQAAAVLLFADAGENGIFGFDLTVIPGATYELTGTIAGQPVSATCTVPGPIQVLEPADGHFRFPANTLIAMPYRFRSAGAKAIAIKNAATSFVGPPVDLEGVWRPFAAFEPGDYLFFLEAYDQAALDFLFRRYWRTNLHGAVGVFGAVTETSVEGTAR